MTEQKFIKYTNFVIIKYGIPNDRDEKIEYDLTSRWSKHSSIKKFHIASYFQQTDGQGEQFNQTVLRMFMCLPEQHKTSRHLHINKLYNCNKILAAGYASYFVLF